MATPPSQIPWSFNGQHPAGPWNVHHLAGIDGEGIEELTKILMKHQNGEDTFVGTRLGDCPAPPNSPQSPQPDDFFENFTKALESPRTLQESPIVPYAYIQAEIGIWITEFEMKDGKSAGVTASKRPWDVYYVNSTVDKNDYAFKVAKNMMNTYATGEFKHSARLRQIISQSGQQWLDEKCAKMLAYKLWFIDRPTEDMSIEERQALEAYQNQRESSTFTPSDGSANSDSHTSPAESSSSASSTASSSSAENSDSEGSSEEIINFRPSNQKPTFRFEPSSIAASLPAFLAAMKASNEELVSGKADKKMELSDDDSGEGEHIEMDLGLGVLEEVKRDSSPILPEAKREDSPALAAPTTTTLKRKPASEESTTPKKIKLQTSNKASDDQIFSASPSPASTAPTTPKKVLLRLIHNPILEDFKPVRKIKKATSVKKAQKSSSDDSSSDKSASDTSSSDDTSSDNDSSDFLPKAKARKSKSKPTKKSTPTNRITEKITTKEPKSSLAAAKGKAQPTINTKDNGVDKRIMISLNIFIKRVDDHLAELSKHVPSEQLTKKQISQIAGSEQSVGEVPRLPLTDPVLDTIFVRTQSNIDGLADIDYTNLKSVLDFSQMVHINVPEFTDFMSDAKVHKWMSNVDPEQLEPFPGYMEPSEEELLAFEHDILKTAQADTLEGYNVVH